MSSRNSFVDGKFLIPSSRVEEMKAVAVAQARKDSNWGEYWQSCQERGIEQEFDAAAEYNNWSMSFDHLGNAVSLYFPNEISDLGIPFLAAIAPFVEPGSYVQMSREGRDTDFRLVFRDGVCYEVWPRLFWPGEEG